MISGPRPGPRRPAAGPLRRVSYFDAETHSLLAGVMDKFPPLKYALGTILVFVGLKMAWLNGAFAGKFPISWSLAIIGSILAGHFFLSLAYAQQRRQVQGPE